MSTAAVLKESEELQGQADTVVEQSGIIKLLEQFGEVEFVGSYPNQLLAWPDIDISIYQTELHENMALQAISAVFKNPYFGRAEIVRGDVAAANSAFAEHYYIRTKTSWENGVETPQGWQRWKLDIWLLKDRELMKELQGHPEFYGHWTEGLTDNQRAVIISAKKELLNHGAYSAGTSVKIYDAVMKSQAKSVDEVIALLD